MRLHKEDAVHLLLRRPVALNPPFGAGKRQLAQKLLDVVVPDGKFVVHKLRDPKQPQNGDKVMQLLHVLPARKIRLQLFARDVGPVLRGVVRVHLQRVVRHRP